MPDLLCLLAGAVAGAVIALALAWGLGRRPTNEADQPPLVVAPPPVATSSVALPSPPPPTPTSAAPARPQQEARALLTAVADQLGSLASGVEGHAHLVLEAAHDRARLPRAAESMWEAVRQLRQFHAKLRAYVQSPAVTDEAVPLEPVLDDVRAALTRRELGLTFAHHLPRTLPPVRGDHQALHDALLLLCGALLKLERGATRITIEAEPSFEQQEPRLALEIRVEWDEDPGRKLVEPLSQAALELDYGAARNLIAAQGGSLEVLRMRGHGARALVQLRAAARPENVATVDGSPVVEAPNVEEPIATPAPQHSFGGVILLEADPALRTMLANELKSAGRAVFACPDSAAARALLQATPDRFELLILDQDARHESGDRLASVAARLCPGIKVCLLGGDSDAVTPAHLAKRLHRLAKPFGLPELRSTLATILAG